MELQEEAAAQCTAPYRAPELWDAPSECVIDERVDVWALGCTLYFILCSRSPFEYTAGAGGSLMLAVMAGNVRWPQTPPGSDPLTDEVKALISYALVADWTRRPTAEKLLQRTRELQTAAFPLGSDASV
mgnify:CR=1 FL=1